MTLSSQSEVSFSQTFLKKTQCKILNSWDPSIRNTMKWLNASSYPLKLFWFYRKIQPIFRQESTFDKIRNDSQSTWGDIWHKTQKLVAVLVKRFTFDLSHLQTSQCASIFCRKFYKLISFQINSYPT